MITTTKLSDEEVDVWHEKIEEIFAVLDETDTAVAINLLIHMAVGLAISDGVTKENLMEGLGLTYDMVYENSTTSEDLH